ncbi:MAG: nuclear transport factor 2 family protein [Pricia sp.]|nr:nuclear transport factor 2 family protein [Pricia sp.]
MKIVLAFVSALLFWPSSSAQVGYQTAELENQIKKLDLAHARAIFEGDAIALDSLMDDDVTVNHPTYRIVKEKKELLELIKKGVIRYTAFDRTQENFLFYEDMVVVMGHEVVVPAKGAPNGEKTLKRRYTNIWMNTDGKWKLTVRHANNICLEN